ncbi:MAG: tRNA (adenosine(37)-N6)-threonylcarbamoyltransferase complex transferase subunit TsaD [Candidatus Pacebacteria bacterium RIFOXYB1_FULL_39_46]|nr:MAG: tRNA (adenosine(37)-N6)-threonylcarbamoyltransferase complex transferase subunit TsaD [Candidatus Pacebacteria bacterium RIFOXYA1_FULL_38_18]OGJ38146.1 MAG: tRNA (adenosine(37)-N6)-threonylcarbamoyltransferase complex transferase subunit TsaD [Candidatus Pacebacteria bacterium RIFOXYB1_FULL_39_46]OGJ39632.1 MAG: tRNA (adenosine(37)-N6)-threonylcarbamoyltransferase complex transferase subunit TsaD [Candidatus Pacebacteria bacterium RIFOXYC1_FULL_39_21]OGJ39898.1 MAG: tRNA (adenosine(37)-N
MSKPLILAIDTSCDETSAAVVRGQVVLSNVIASQAQIHQRYGGVFPTAAKQAHQENIQPVIKTALRQASLARKITEKWSAIDAIAVTQGPGLAPALEIGLQTALNLGKQHQKPVIPVNHIEGHVLSVLAQAKARKKLHRTIKPKLPVLSVIVSGGHTEFILIKKIGQYRRLGMTVDDAAGECLDKIGRLLNLGYPAAPIVEQLAKKGDKNRFDFPLPMTNVANFNMSFSGLKTHSQRLIKRLIVEEKLDQKTINDFCASLQEGVFSHIIYKLEKLLDQIEIKELWLGGGVAANLILRAKLRSLARSQKLSFRAPYSSKLTGDNAAMIGVAGSYILARKPSFKAQKLDRRPSWPISQQ